MNKVSFKGPYMFLKHDHLPSIFESDIKNKHGIYIWTFPFKNKELIYYVGITNRTFKERFTEHLKGYLSGEYGINDPVELREGKRVRIWDGLWRGANIEDFIERHTELFPKMLDLLNIYKIYAAPLNFNGRFLERIEAGIARYLRNQPGIVGTFQETEIRYKKRRKNEDPEFIELECHSEIIGLPQTLEV